MNDLTTGSSTWEAFCNYITHLAAKDANIVVVENDDRLYTTFKTIIDKKQLFHSSASSANMILNAAGFALNGKKPLVIGSTNEIVSSGYAAIREALAIPSLPVCLISANGGLSLGHESASNQIIEDVAVMRAIPELTVLVPSHAAAVSGIMDFALSLASPVYVRLGLSKTEIIQSDAVLAEEFQNAGAKIVKSGTDVTICSCGIMVSEAVKAANELGRQGINAEVIDCYCIKPFPEQVLLASVRRTGCCVVAEEGSRIGGLYGAVSESLGSTCQVPVRAVAIGDHFVDSGTPDELRAYCGLTSNDIVNAAAQVWPLRRR
jgi:transketolase